MDPWEQPRWKGEKERVVRRSRCSKQTTKFGLDRCLLTRLSFFPPLFHFPFFVWVNFVQIPLCTGTIQITGGKK